MFENILEMARLDAGAIAAESRWTHPSEMVAAAREQVDRTLRGHSVRVIHDKDVPVLLDPRLTASALARLLENAAQYAPAGSAIEIRTSVTGEGLTIGVRDYGQGIPPGDLPHLFERFYRGAAAGTRASGTGMGLSIARGLMAVIGGRIWAENAPDAGACFTMVIPADVREAEPAASPAS
jgi:two-component system sensor histidine kinase KdpD